MRRTHLASFAAAGVAALSAASPAFAHCWAGSRFLPATLAIDDPCVMDELALPTVSWTKTNDQPPARKLDISGEFSKRITENFGVSVGSAFTRFSFQDGRRGVTGWQNLETTFKYQFLTAPEAEFIASAGLAVEWGNTGNASVGAEKFTVLTPTVWFGKGFGDLPNELGLLRPLAVTGQFGYQIPTWARTVSVTATINDDGGVDFGTDIDRHPRVLVYGATLQYSLPYLNANVVDLGLPSFVNQLVPLVEARFATPIANLPVPSTFADPRRTTGTVNPGVVFVDKMFQIAAEAVIPINRTSGRGVGWVVQLHFYLDDMFPTTIGRPLIDLASEVRQ